MLLHAGIKAWASIQKSSVLLSGLGSDKNWPHTDECLYPLQQKPVVFETLEASSFLCQREEAVTQERKLWQVELNSIPVKSIQENQTPVIGPWVHLLC